MRLSNEFKNTGCIAYDRGAVYYVRYSVPVWVGAYVVRYAVWRIVIIGANDGRGDINCYCYHVYKLSIT